VGLLARLTATLAATSADDGSGGWVVGVDVGQAECVPQGVDGLALEAEPYVGEDAGGGADVGVAEAPARPVRLPPSSPTLLMTSCWNRKLSWTGVRHDPRGTPASLQ
jgi:hypothetical protein